MVVYHIDDFQRDVTTEHTHAGLWSSFVRFFRSRNLPAVSYIATPYLELDNSGPRLLSDGVADDWINQYVERSLNEIDPRIHYAQKWIHPFSLNQIEMRSDLSEEHKQFLNLRRRAGIENSLTLPLFGPFGCTGTVGVLCRNRDFTFGSSLVQELYWAAQTLHLGFCNLTQKNSAERFDLTPREVEILQCVSTGKSNNTIAEIMGVSTHTVDTHLRRIYRKLDVSDRVTASLKGLSTGLVMA